MISGHRPIMKMLTDEMVEKIVAEALDVLEHIGVFVDNEAAIKLLREAGMKIKEHRVFITEKLIHDCLKTTPKSIKIYDRDGNPKMVLNNNNIYFVTGSAALNILDSRGKIRKPSTQDYIDFTQLTDSLPYIAAQSTTIIPADVHEELTDRYRLYLSLIHSTKPIVTGTFTKEGFVPMKEMLVTVRGTEDSLRQKPLAIFDVCPSPPLKWSDLTCQCLIDCARSSIPAELVSMPLAGATAPVTLSGALVQHTAESLSGIVIGQLAQRGAPIIYGGSPAVFDMRYGTTPMGAIGTMMLDCAYAQIGKYLGLPTHTYMGLSDSKTLDSQSGLESGIGMILAALAGINVIAGAGMLAFENCQSMEKLVIDNEICGMALRLVKGIVQREEPMAKTILEECIERGDFLSHQSTLKWFKEELLMPSSVINRMNTEVWKKEGKKTSLEHAKEEAKRILKTYTPKPLEESIAKELKDIMQKEASRYGMCKLPS